MFDRTVIVLFLAILGFSWTPASVVPTFHRDQGSVHALDFLRQNYDNDGSESATGEEFESEQGSSSPKFRNKYEAQIYKIYTIISSPQDKYVEILSPTSVTFGHDPYLDNTEPTFSDDSIENLLQPHKRDTFALHITHTAFLRVQASCHELEETLDRYIINGEPTPLQNASGMTSEEKQNKIKVILKDIASAKLLLQDLWKILDAFLSDKTDFIKSVNGMSIDKLISKTLSLMTSVKRSWVDWKMMLYNAKNSDGFSNN